MHTTMSRWYPWFYFFPALAPVCYMSSHPPVLLTLLTTINAYRLQSLAITIAQVLGPQGAKTAK